MSDDQVRDILKQGEARGLSIADGEKLALGMGLPASEAAAFKDRVALLNGPTKMNMESPIAPPSQEKATLRPSAVVPKADTTKEAPKEEKPKEVEAVDNQKPALFGRSIYQSGNLKLMGQATDTKAPDTYILGPGDELVVSIFGVSYANELLKIDSRGTATVKGMGSFYLTGLTYGAARKLIRAKFGQYYDLNNNQMEITLLFSRVIRVNVVGEVANPGTYEFSALNSVFNALLAAGGPNDAGSLRQIEVQRGGKVVYKFDTYHFLAGKLSLTPFSLDDQDYLVVKPLGRVVELEGAVRKPASYELLPGESLKELVEWAGGLSSNAYAGSIQRITFANGAREVREYQWMQGQLPKEELLDGDQILVRGLPSDVRNGVEIAGEVNQPGTYTLTPNLKVSTLLKRAGGLKPTAYGEKAFLSRKREDGQREMMPIYLTDILSDTMSSANLLLQAYDKIEVVSKTEFIDLTDIKVSGAVRKPGNFPFEDNLTIGDVLLKAGGLKPDAYSEKAFLSRRRRDGQRETLPLALGDSLAINAFRLQPFDEILIVNKADFLDETDIRVFGAVRKPGNISFQQNLTLGDVLLQVGGLKPEADAQKVEIVRLALFDNQNKSSQAARATFVSLELKNGQLAGADLARILMPYDRVYVRTLADFVSPATVVLEGEFRYPGTYALLSRDERMVDLIERAGGFKPQAFVAAAKFYRETAPGGQVLIDLEKVLNRENSRYNYTLLDGDRLIVPEYVPYVSLQGPGIQYIQTTGLEAVNAPYKPGVRANRYVQRYGDGFSTKANKKRVFVVAANDKVSRTKNLVLFKIYPKVGPGGTVYVMEKEITKKEKQQGEPVNWNRVIENTTVKLTGLATLIILLRQL